MVVGVIDASYAHLGVFNCKVDVGASPEVDCHASASQTPPTSSSISGTNCVGGFSYGRLTNFGVTDPSYGFAGGFGGLPITATCFSESLSPLNKIAMVTPPITPAPAKIHGHFFFPFRSCPVG